MPSQDKLIKTGIKYTDQLFEVIIKKLQQGVSYADSLEAFLEYTSEYTSQNPMVTSGYDSKMINIILQETNNHRFSRPAQKELTRITIENRVGELIRDVGEDIKQQVRDIVLEEYNRPEGRLNESALKLRVFEISVQGLLQELKSQEPLLYPITLLPKRRGLLILL